MPTLLRRSQSLGVALVVLAMTATVAFAAADLGGGSRGASHRDQTLADANESPDASEAPESETPESEAPESDAPDESGAPDGSAGLNSPDASGGVNHGDLVSVAASMPTPAGFPNHGAFVSCVAHMPHDVDPATFDWTTVTPEACGLVSGVGTTNHGHGHHWGFAGTHRHGRPTGG